MIEDKAVLNAYWLYKDGLIDRDIFYKTIEKIKQGMTTQTPTSYTPEITQGQVNYIKRLQSEGKIPRTQTLLITKAEAQILIHNAVNNQPNKTEGVPDNTAHNELAQTGSAKTPEELKDLYEGGEDY